MTTAEGVRRSLRGLSEPEFRDRFASEEACRKALFEMRWREDLTCPSCGHRGFCELKARKVFPCHRCKKQVSLRAGTVFQDSKLPLTTWFSAIYQLTQAKGGISSIELARRLGGKKRRHHDRARPATPAEPARRAPAHRGDAHPRAPALPALPAALRAQPPAMKVAG